MSKIKVNSIEAATGSTITIPSGQTLDISSTTLTLPSTVVTTTGTQTLTNKTIGVSQLTGTLPVANGGTGLTALGTASQVLRVNSGATALEFGTISSGANAGEVIQVLGATDTTTRNTTSTSYVTASNTLSVTITPSSTANKIFIIMTVNVIGGGTARGDFTIYRGATNLAANAGGLMFPFDTDVYDQNGTTTFLDSPNTTSATTYQMYMKAPNGGTIGTYVNGNGTNSITVFEIKG